MVFLLFYICNYVRVAFKFTMDKDGAKSDTPAPVKTQVMIYICGGIPLNIIYWINVYLLALYQSD